MNKRVLPVLLLTFLVAAPIVAQQVSVQSSETPERWFVELSSPPTADGGSLSATQADKQAFRLSANRAGIAIREHYSFDTLFNGLSLSVNPLDAARLRDLDGVKAVYPVVTIAPPEPRTENDPNLVTALAMTGADIVQNDLGYTGSGIRVGIIDTGVDYHHPDLGGCFGPGCRVSSGYDFVGNAYNSSLGTPPIPDPDPDDCNGHGTHVAGIVGANGVVKGVAPGVTFGAYRVFGCAGTTSADIMIAAMERALADGMNVVNMSIGSSRQWPQYPTAAASTRLVNKQVIVVASAGNDAAIGLYGSSAPAVGSKVISVASFDNTHTNLTAFTISPDNMPIGYSNATAAPPAPLSGSLVMARTGTATSTADACVGPLPAGLAGKAVLIRRGTCSFYQKSRNAQNAGAAAVVIYNNVPGRVGITVAGSPPITIPVVSISDTEGVTIDGRLAAGAVTMTWTSGTISSPNATAALISSFSSWGVSPDLTLKPDISAPGGFIRSTYPIELGSYAVLSGTSMSSPHVAGAIALLLQAKPNTSHQTADVILQNSADPRPTTVGGTNLVPVHRQGGGMLDIDDAILATTKIEPGKLSLGESETGPAIRTLHIENNANTAVTYDLSHAPALATGPNTFTVAMGAAPATVTFNAPSVTVPAGGSASVTATIAPNAALPDRSLYGGYIVFTPQGGGSTYRVPFAGFKGDYQSIPALTPTPAGFPWLAKLVGSTFFNQPSGATFTLAGGDVPYILLHLDHSVRRLRMEVFDAVTGKAWHRASDDEYIGRNTAPTSFYAFLWNGVTRNGNKINTVPDGAYVMNVTVVKALGDESSPSHVETWTSPIITIDRP